MAQTPRRVSRFKKRVSDRSGFDFREQELTLDGPWKVGPDERDTPPPSKQSLGGEGDVSGDPRASSNFDTIVNVLSVPAVSQHPTTLIGVAGITPDTTHPWMYIAPTDATVDITTDPQIASGRQSQILSLQVVSNSLLLEDGNGLSLLGGASLYMESGSIVNFIYDTGSNVWQETSRTR